ncbi:MAG: eukaryotic-like serine/threonine-protein kinase [Blastocatellia bacterium]|jgi:serine/threonine protein kinase|nr:eukaryotic-like serine/threonine-protein kinase [Blastocatellia bacterium]
MRECPRCERCYEDDALLCPDDQAKTKLTLPGTTLLNRRYRLDKRLGRGAMGQVYLARDENLITRRVAVKTIRPDVLSDEDLQEGEAIARFEREARTAASIQHPNVIDVNDFGKSDEGVFFLVMEYVEGESLYQLLRREGTLSLQRAQALLKQICAGVEAAHDEGILHRDLKPANVFIVQKKKKDGSISVDDMVKVGDFGLAKIISGNAGDASGSGPASRGILGTPEYMAPEQMQSGANLDARADIYALGAMAYHMLGGRPPFTGDIMQIFAAKLTGEAPALSTLHSDIPKPVERAVMHALKREADGRPPSVAVWFNEFDEAVSGTTVKEDEGESRLVIMAPSGAEVYVDDERHGSIGRSGRVILKSLPPGQHVLRVAHGGDADDERVIEIRADGDEQIIQAQFKSAPSSGLSPSQGGSLGSVSGMALPTHTVVACTRCGSRFAGATKFCGRCGNTAFQPVTSDSAMSSRIDPQSPPSLNQPSLNQPSLNRPSLNQPGVGPSRIRCTRCSMEQPAGTKFCGRCGASLGGSAIAWNAPRPVEVLCSGCNSTYPSGTKFCGRCGRTL